VPLGNNESANARDARSNVSVPAEKLSRAKKSGFANDGADVGDVVIESAEKILNGNKKLTVCL
jgi:hypothetical protein